MIGAGLAIVGFAIAAIETMKADPWQAMFVLGVLVMLAGICLAAAGR